MRVDPNEKWFADLDIGGVDGQYVSPYPNWNDVASKGFLAKTQPSSSPNSMREFADPGLGTKTAMTAYNRVLQVSAADILTSDITGGIQFDWLPEIGITSELREGTAKTISGIFAFVRFDKTTDPIVIAGRMAEYSLNIAINFLGAVPIVGWIAAAAIAVGKAFYNLKKISDREKRPDPLIVPWQQQSSETDEWVVNEVIREIVRSENWTPLWMPRIDSSYEGWRALKSSQGDGTRVYGCFDNNGAPRYNNPAYGLGAIPNTQMISDFIQFLAPGTQSESGEMKAFGNRRDQIVNTGDFYPSISQIATTLWSWANRGGSPDMYKVDTYALEDALRPYWESFFEDGFEQIAYIDKKKGTSVKDFLTATAIGKSLANFYVLGCSPQIQAGKIGSEGCQIGIDPLFLQSVGNLNAPELSNCDVFTENNPLSIAYANKKYRYYGPFDAIIMPALKTLRQRQWSYLAKSTVCSLVRYNGSQPFAAFANNQDRWIGEFGGTLAKRCHDMRALLLKDLARYSVKDVDVRPVDPQFANELKASKQMVPNFPLAGEPPLDVKPLAKIAQIPDALPPQGGVPFQHVLMGDLPESKKKAGGAGIAIAAAAALGAVMMSKK